MSVAPGTSTLKAAPRQPVGAIPDHRDAPFFFAVLAAAEQVHQAVFGYGTAEVLIPDDPVWVIRHTSGFQIQFLAHDSDTVMAGVYFDHKDGSVLSEIKATYRIYDNAGIVDAVWAIANALALEAGRAVQADLAKAAPQTQKRRF